MEIFWRDLRVRNSAVVFCLRVLIGMEGDDGDFLEGLGSVVAVVAASCDVAILVPLSLNDDGTVGRCRGGEKDDERLGNGMGYRVS